MKTTQHRNLTAETRRHGETPLRDAIQEAEKINRKELKDRRESMVDFDWSLRSLRSLRLTSVA